MAEKDDAASKAADTAQADKQKVLTVSNIGSLQKAAVILMSLDEKIVQSILSSLTQYEIKVLSKALSRVEEIDMNSVESTLREAVTYLQKSSLLKSSVDDAKRILASIGIDDNYGGDEFFEGETWKKLSHVDGEVLASYFISEHPQSIALVASKLSVTTSAKFLSALPKDIIPGVLLRIAKMDSVRSDLLNSIGEALKTEFVINSSTEKVDYKKRVADIINACDRNAGEEFITNLKEIDAEVAGYIEENIFTFERLLSIDNSGIQRLMRDLDKSQLAIALKGTSKEIKDLFFQNMSERAAKIIKDDMTSMGPVKVSDVESSQSYIIGAVRDLINQGEVSLAEEQGGGLVE